MPGGKKGREEARREKERIYAPAAVPVINPERAEADSLSPLALSFSSCAYIYIYVQDAAYTDLTNSYSRFFWHPPPRAFLCNPGTLGTLYDIHIEV